MRLSKKLLSYINLSKTKNIFYKKKIINTEDFKNDVIQKAKIFKKKIMKGCVVSISSQNKYNYLVNLYAGNLNGYSLFPTTAESLKKIQQEKIEIHYHIRGNKITKISPIKKKTKTPCLILKSSGSSGNKNYVYLSDSSLIYVAKNLNKKMSIGQIKNNCELVFCPIDHAFGLGRIIALLNSKASFAMLDNYRYSEFYNCYQAFNCNSFSTNAKILSNLISINYLYFKKKIKKCMYVQTSSGFLPIKIRKKLIRMKINLFINYGSTEAMRTTFLNCSKFPSKIHTEGKPFLGTKVKILKLNKKNKVGEILIKGKNLAIGYSDKKKWNKKFFNGWYRSGDLGYLDSNGFLSFKGRISDIININDKKISVDFIEESIKKIFKKNNIKILNLIEKKNNFYRKLYLFVEKKLDIHKMYVSLKKKGIDINFQDIIKIKKIPTNQNGKVDFNLLKKYIYEKRN